MLLSDVNQYAGDLEHFQTFKGEMDKKISYWEKKTVYLFVIEGFHYCHDDGHQFKLH